MGLIAAIVGLAVLVMIHEAGHFVAARAVGMTPRKFYLGFGPPIAKTMRGGVEYGIGSIPLGGYVKIPGMNRPSPGDLAATLRPEDRETYRGELARLDDAIEHDDFERARGALDELAPCARHIAGLAGARMVAGTRRVLAAGDVAQADGDLRGACRQPALRDRPVRRPLLVASERNTNIVGRVVTGSPAAGRARESRRPDPARAGTDGRSRTTSPSTSGPRKASRSRSSSAATASGSCSARCAPRRTTAPTGSASPSRRAPGPASRCRRRRATRCADVERSPPTRSAGSVISRPGATRTRCRARSASSGSRRRRGDKGCATSSSSSASSVSRSGC